MKTARVLLALAAAAGLPQLHAQAIYKCVGADGKTSYSHSPCPNAKQVRGGSGPSQSSGGGAAESADVSLIPALQHGKWAWKNVEGDTCGDPLEKYRRRISAAYTEAPNLGCKRQLSAPGPGNMVFVLDCPADRSENGVSVQKGRTEISVYAPTPQLVRIATKAPDSSTEIFEAQRIGDCGS